MHTFDLAYPRIYRAYAWLETYVMSAFADCLSRGCVYASTTKNHLLVVRLSA